MSWLFGPTVQKLERALDRTFLQQTVTVHNIANADTPGYHAKKVIFSDELDRSMSAYRTRPEHIPFSRSTEKARVITKDGTTLLNNGNNVNMDREMANLARQQIQYQALITRLNGKFRALEMVLRGGR